MPWKELWLTSVPAFTPPGGFGAPLLWRSSRTRRAATWIASRVAWRRRLAGPSEGSGYAGAQRVRLGEKAQQLEESHGGPLTRPRSDERSHGDPGNYLDTSHGRRAGATPWARAPAAGDDELDVDKAREGRREAQQSLEFKARVQCFLHELGELFPRPGGGPFFS